MTGGEYYMSCLCVYLLMDGLSDHIANEKNHSHPLQTIPQTVSGSTLYNQTTKC